MGRSMKLVECVYCEERFALQLAPRPTSNMRVTVGAHACYWLAWQCPNHNDEPERDHGWQHDRDQLGCIQVGELAKADRTLFDRYEHVDPWACARTVHPSAPAIDLDDVIDAADICRGPDGDRRNTPLFDQELADLINMAGGGQ